MKAQPMPVKCIPKPTAKITSSIRSLSLLPFKRRNTRDNFWGRKFLGAPHRPVRPPAEQCPPPQEYLTNYERAGQRWINVPIKLDLSEAAPDSSNVRHGVAHETVKQVVARGDALVRHNHVHSIHHNLAYSLLTGSEVHLEQSLDHVDRTQHHRMSSSPAVAERWLESGAGQPVHVPEVWYAQNNSFSSLPTTASKVALRPSPLRVLKEDDVAEQTPPVPLRSPSRVLFSGSNYATASSAVKDGFVTDGLILTRSRSSSYTTASLYSSNADEVTPRQEKTPSSSPAPFPIRSTSLSQALKNDASKHAEEIRERLGIIDDIYDMYADTNTVKRERHEALTDDIQDQVVHLSEVGRSRSQEVSRTQKRVAKERARREAAQHLVRSDSGSKARDTEFEHWLDSIVHRDPEEKNPSTLHHLSNKGHDELPNSADTNSSRRNLHLSQPSEENEHPVIAAHQREIGSNRMIQANAREGRHQSPSLVSHSLAANLDPVTARNDVGSMINLNDLRGQLLALMADDVNDAQQQDESALSEVTRTPSSSSSSQFSMSTEATEDMPLNLQSIVIEWNGKRYPVLIGERGKIWEGPCTARGCRKHGKRVPGQADVVV